MHLTKKKKIQYREVTNDYDEESLAIWGKKLVPMNLSAGRYPQIMIIIIII